MCPNVISFVEEDFCGEPIDALASSNTLHPRSADSAGFALSSAALSLESFQVTSLVQPQSLDSSTHQDY